MPKKSEGEMYLISFLDKNKRTIDHQLVKEPDLNSAKRRAITIYSKIGDRGIYAGFVVQKEIHGGY